jgi:hypothetical protein
MLSCLAIVPRGAAKEVPDQQELSAAELNALVQKQAGMSMEELVSRHGNKRHEEEHTAERNHDIISAS